MCIRAHGRGTIKSNTPPPSCIQYVQTSRFEWLVKTVPGAEMQTEIETETHIFSAGNFVSYYRTEEIDRERRRKGECAEERERRAKSSLSYKSIRV